MSGDAEAFGDAIKTFGNKNCRRSILVTGGCGFVGGHVAEKLLNRGDRVVCIDSMNEYYNKEFKYQTLKILEQVANDSDDAQTLKFDSPSDEDDIVDSGVTEPEECPAISIASTVSSTRTNFSLSRPQQWQRTRFAFRQVDICDTEQMNRVFTELGPFDVVVHLAAQAGVRFSVDNPQSVILTNVLGTQVVFDMCYKHNVGYIVAASSSSVYGESSVAPFSEDQVCNAPRSPYAASKRANELFAYSYNHLYKKPVTMLRFFTVYGPRGRPDMAAFKFIDKIQKGKAIDKFGDGSAIREFTYIDDIVDGVLRSIDRVPGDGHGLRIVNLGGGSTHTLNEFIGFIENHVNKKAIINQMPDQPGDVAITCACQKKASVELGFKPKISLDEGIRRTVEWYNSCEYLK